MLTDIFKRIHHRAQQNQPSYLTQAKMERLQGRPTFQEGDVVLAKCVDCHPEPAIVGYLRGFDEGDYEIYKVNFLAVQGWSFLPSYCLQHLTLKHIAQLINTMGNNFILRKSLSKAHTEIVKYESRLGGICKQRFNQIYLSNQPMNQSFFNQGHLIKPNDKRPVNISIMSNDNTIQINTVEKIERKQAERVEKKKISRRQKAFKRCKFICHLELTILIYSVEDRLRIDMKWNNFISSYEEDITDMIIPKDDNVIVQGLKVITEKDINMIYQQSAMREEIRQNDDHFQGDKIMVAEEKSIILRSEEATEGNIVFQQNNQQIMGEKEKQSSQISQEIIFYQQIKNEKAITEKSFSTVQEQQSQQSAIPVITKELQSSQMIQTQKEFQTAFKGIQSYLQQLSKQKNYLIEVPYQPLNNLDLVQREKTVKQRLTYLGKHQLSSAQIEIIFKTISPYIDMFLETYSPRFLLCNIIKIKGLSNKNKEGLLFESVPVLGLFEFVDSFIASWLTMFENKCGEIASKIEPPNYCEKTKTQMTEIRTKFKNALAPVQRFLKG